MPPEDYEETRITYTYEGYPQIDTATLSSLVTMNTELMKDMLIKEVLKFHPLINTETLAWKQAQKTAPIKVKPSQTHFDNLERRLSDVEDRLGHT